MKLLSKNEVQVAKAQERKSEIDTGLTLARRIDSLRETLSKEQKEWNSFHTETVAMIQNDVDKLITQRDTLNTEIKSLEDKKKIALEPIENQVKEMLLKAEENRVEAENTLKSARAKMTKTLIRSKEIEAESIKRSNQITLRERKVIDMELALNSKLLNND